MKLKQKETGKTGVMRTVTDLLTAEKIRWWRLNAGDRFGSYKGKKWRIRGHAKGTPDILAIPHAGVIVDNVMNGTKYCTVKYLPIPLWIEVKAPGKHPTAEQLQFADEARLNGEYHMFIDDVAVLQKWLKENRAR